MAGKSSQHLIFHALGDENRLKIIDFIGKEKRAVTEIVTALGLSQPLVSHHLRILREAQVLSTTREGPFIYYHIKDQRFHDALKLFLEIFIS